MMNIKVAALASALAFGMAASASAAVVNGSFETLPGPLNMGNWGNFGTAGIDGWTANNGGLEIQTEATVGLKPQDGNYYVELDSNSNSSIFQTVSLAAGKYLLSFWFSPRVKDGDAQYSPGTNDVSYGVSGGLLSGLVAGAPSDSYPFGVWTKITSLFTVKTAGDYVLNFTAEGSSNTYGGFVDNVSIEPSPVPVPAAGLLLLTALGGVAALRRRKSA